MHVFIIGADSMLGQSCMTELCNQGFDITGLALSADVEIKPHSSLHLIESNLFKAENWADQIYPGTIVLLTMENWLDDPTLYMEGVELVVKQAAEKGASRLILTATEEALWEINRKKVVDNKASKGVDWMRLHRFMREAFIGWTFFCFSGLSEKQSDNLYQLSHSIDADHLNTVHASNFAKAVVECIKTDTFLHQMVYIRDKN